MSDICRYNQTGNCKHGRHCQKRHVNEICADGRECKNSLCLRRHPRTCKYFEKQSQCRFDEHAFAHEKNPKTVKIEFLERKIVELKSDIVILKKNFHYKTKLLSKQVAQLNSSMFEMSKKFEILKHDKKNNDNIVKETKLSQKT